MPGVNRKLRWIKTMDPRMIKRGTSKMFNKTLPTENFSNVNRASNSDATAGPVGCPCEAR